MIRCLRTTCSARSRPASVRIASLCSPRSTSPSASSRFSISPAEARETPSISATREASVGEPVVARLVLADREREEVDRLQVVVDAVCLVTPPIVVHPARTRARRAPADPWRTLGVLSAFFHAVTRLLRPSRRCRVEVRSALALACHVVKLLLRGRAWRTILARRLSREPDRAIGAHSARMSAGVGVNSVVPARGGDVVKLYLIKQRDPGLDLRDADPDADRRDALRLRRLRRDHRLGARRSASCRRTRSTRGSRSSTGSFFVRHAKCTGAADRGAPGRRDRRVRLRSPARRATSGRASRRASRSCTTGAGCSAASSSRRRSRGCFRVASRLLLPAGVPRARDDAQRAARAGRRLAGDALPGDTGRRRDEAGADRLPVPRRGDLASPAARVQRRHEHRARRHEPRVRLHRDRADGADVVVQAASRRRAGRPRRSGPGLQVALRVRLSARRRRARSRARSPTRSATTSRSARSSSIPFGRRGRAGSWSSCRTRRRPASTRVAVEGVVGSIPPALVELALLAGRLLRLDAGAGARARRAASCRSGARSSRRPAARQELADEQPCSDSHRPSSSPRSSGSWRRSTPAAATSCCTA